MNKKIYLHYDMDAFFASVEQRDNPRLRGIPIAVGYGVVTTASYEARKYGVKSAMPVVEAKRLCPNLTLVRIDKEKYFRVGREIQNLIKRFTDKYEFTSVDEGYIDITEFIKNNNIEKFVRRFKEYIFKNVGLTCSVGIGFSKVSAKIASDINKPNGYFIFWDREQFVEYLKDKELSIIPGIGKKTRETLKMFKVETGKDLYGFDKFDLINKFGNVKGEFLYNVVRGLHFSEINNARKRQSYGREVTFNHSINDVLELEDELRKQSKILSEKLKEKKEFIKTVTLKIRYSNFVTHTKAKRLKNATNDYKQIADMAIESFRSLEKKNEVRLIGVQLSSITKTNIVQLTFDDLEFMKKKKEE